MASVTPDLKLHNENFDYCGSVTCAIFLPGC